MMTQELAVSVLSAPLAAIDRRAISQAWYSALHRCEERRCAEKPLRKAAGTQAGVSLKRAPHAECATPVKPDMPRGTVTTRPGSVIGAASERRQPRQPLAREIERLVRSSRPAPRRTIVTFAAKRVHLTVQSDAGGLRLIALCAPSVRAVVARALAQARFALAARRVDATLEAACF